MNPIILTLIFFLKSATSDEHAIKKRWNWHDEGNLWWAEWCDWNNNDMRNVQGRSEQCGGICTNTRGCTHFSWTGHNGGTCWLKKNSVSLDQAKGSNGGYSVCGMMKNQQGPAPGPAPAPAPSGGFTYLSGVQYGKTTRYWDCCKVSCGWNGKANVNNPVQSCDKGGWNRVDKDAQSGCNGGPSYACNSNQPWAVNDNLAYGFAAAHLSGQSERDWCCGCYELTFTNGPVQGKRLVVQVTNTGGDLGENHFDLQIPGGGVGIFNGCQSQWGAPWDGWGARYGGVGSRDQCGQLPNELQKGCFFRFDWFKNADNPGMSFRRVKCPAEITEKSSCKRNDE